MAEKKLPDADSWLDRKTRIDPSDPADVALWGLVLGVSADVVLEATQAVGTDPEAVRKHLLRR
ncbi:DUF3606 domain-containing protein [Luteibacter yeojuensis]|uniref:DUF3606 domain-containing protein n=1 Tax=Luteibacter yeojuensis TaxID=345309 RepID=UPI0005F76D8C|nr:DUF3606 domain-containing protein [Luteibacter yeojuensis]